MTSEEFVNRIRIVVYESSIEGTLSLLDAPPGRSPSLNLVGLSQWHSHLSNDDRRRVQAVVELAVRASVFGMLTVLDGVTSIRETNEEPGRLELSYTTETNAIQLNDPNGELLHDIFAAEVPPV